MNNLDRLESKSIHILREAYSEFKNICMLWSIGKDSTVMLWLMRKAFFGHAPIPLIHIDTSFEIPEIIEHRDYLTKKWNLCMIYGMNEDAIEKKLSFADGKITRLQCCKLLKTEALIKTIDGTYPRYRFNHDKGKYEIDKNKEPYTGVIVGARADEEGSRSKERYFSPRNIQNKWELEEQPPEIWDQYKTDFAPGTHVRIHPLLDWTELDIWEYIKRENIPMVPLYFDQGDGTRHRSLGCVPCTKPIKSTAKTVDDVIAELKTGILVNIAERSGRDQDKEDDGGLESLRKEGYM